MFGLLHNFLLFHFLQYMEFQKFSFTFIMCSIFGDMHLTLLVLTFKCGVFVCFVSGLSRIFDAFVK